MHKIWSTLTSARAARIFRNISWSIAAVMVALNVLHQLTK